MLKRPAPRRSLRAGNRTLLAVLTMLAAAVAFAVATVPSASAATPVRIMPLGDSITGSPGCWRALLWNRLQSSRPHRHRLRRHARRRRAAGSPTTATTRATAASWPPTSPTRTSSCGWLAAHPARHRDHALRHERRVEQHRTATILAAFSQAGRPDAGQQPEHEDPRRQDHPDDATAVRTVCPERVVDLNNAIPAWAAGKTTAPVSRSPWSTSGPASTPPTDTYDGVHPNATGDQKISDRWFPALTAALGTTTPPVDTTPPTARRARRPPRSPAPR